MVLREGIMQGRVALVTAAASDSGAAIAMRLAQAGFIVYGTSSEAVDCETPEYAMLAMDVRSELSVDEAVKTVIEREGRIDLLVNSAALNMAPAGAEESSVHQAQALFDTNFFGMVRMSRAVLPHMRGRRSGRIINFGSALGAMPLPFGALYSAARLAIDGYTGSLDQELREWGIRAMLIEPAFTSSLFDRAMLEVDQPLDEYNWARTSVSRRLRQLVVVAEGNDVIAEVVLKAAFAKRPKLRYPVGGLAARLRLLGAYTLFDARGGAAMQRAQGLAAPLAEVRPI
jgi:NAD(P)-dependent dehydrogenase (short-subunit alcohol dehydrogenase family)